MKCLTAAHPWNPDFLAQSLPLLVIEPPKNEAIRRQLPILASIR